MKLLNEAIEPLAKACGMFPIQKCQNNIVTAYLNIMFLLFLSKHFYELLFYHNHYTLNYLVH